MKSKILIISALFFVFLALGWAGNREDWATAVEAATESTIPVVNRESVRNGEFNLYGSSLIDGWRKRGGGSFTAEIEPTGDPQGGPAVKLYGNYGDPAAVSGIYQETHLPTAVTAATLSFDVRVVQTYQDSAPQGEVVMGWVAVIPVTGDDPPNLNDAIVSGNMFADSIGAPTGWMQFSAPFDASGVQALNNARSANQRLVLLLAIFSDGWRLSLLVDNVSLKLDGSQTAPNFTGQVAYIHQNQVRRVDPATAGAQTIWSHPGENPEIHTVRWNPAATELAIASDHERFYSPMAADIYGIRPKGTELRRITNWPSQSELAAANYPKGNVLVHIYNNAGNGYSPFNVLVRGASELKSLPVPAYQSSASLLIENVSKFADEQLIFFVYSGPACGGVKRDTAGVVTIIPGQTVEINLTFNATLCTVQVPYAREIAWSPNGAEIGYVNNNTPFKIESAGRTTPGSPWFSAGLMSSLAWSPNGQYALHDSAIDGIFIKNLNSADPSHQIIPPTLFYPEKPIWLPDGSRFLYIHQGNIFSADPQGNNKQQLTFFPSGDEAVQASPSPNGQHIVFERRMGDVSTLWLMERNNPANMWPLIAGTKPDWSRVNPSAPVPPPPSHFIYLPLALR
jgi:hypothetical protein